LARQPALDELAEAFPDEWHEVQRDVGQALAGGGQQQVVNSVAALSRPARVSGPGGRRNGDQALVSEQVRRYLTAALLRQISLEASTGVTSGRIRFNLLNGWTAQRLLFARGLERKPVSLPWFRLVWPLVWQKRLLMPLVERQGIYCFYSRPLIAQLANLIGDRPCLEIAAGDGTLTRFLTARGVQVTATDDHSWSQSVTYPASVVRKEARAALRQYQPEVVICSWPPAGNAFEREVFGTRSVRLYIVISCRAEANAGNWADYRRQTAFALSEDPALSQLVLPPELAPAVYVFRRRS
jgi:hypothetical protein